MKNTKSHNENCTSCVHFGYCMVYWGVECKRQGGKRIPRMKPTPVNILEKTAETQIELMQVSMYQPDITPTADRQKPDKSQTNHKQEMIKKILHIFEPVKTKVANW